MKKILLIRRIQTDQEWEQDCYNIAIDIVKELDYKFPNVIYTKLLEEGLGRYIAEEEIYSSLPIDLEGLFYEVFRQGFDYALEHEDDPDYFEFDLTIDDVSKINQLIEKHTRLYYQTDKKDLINKLNSLPKDTVIIYPKKFYLKILKAFYKHSYDTFFSSHNNDTECLEEFYSLNNIKNYTVMKL